MPTASWLSSLVFCLILRVTAAWAYSGQWLWLSRQYHSLYIQSWRSFSSLPGMTSGSWLQVQSQAFWLGNELEALLYTMITEAFLAQSTNFKTPITSTEMNGSSSSQNPYQNGQDLKAVLQLARGNATDKSAKTLASMTNASRGLDTQIYKAIDQVFLNFFTVATLLITIASHHDRRCHTWWISRDSSRAWTFHKVWQQPDPSHSFKIQRWAC